MEEQRGDSGGFAEAFDTADEDGVVATGVGSFVGHFEGGAAAGEDRGAAGAGLPGEAGKAVGRPGGEAVGEVFLLGRQDVDGVVAGFLEGRQVVRTVVQAPEDQRRVERDGREGIDGQADGVPVRIDGRDDGDTGGEAAKGVAQARGCRIGLESWVERLGRLKKRPYYPCSRSLSRGRIWPRKPFTEQLIAWQKRAGRHDLPWQNTRDPYRIWLSEIMLQQTQVATVIPYYLRFLDSFPTVTALAAAPIEAVIEHWAGLGYYARARNLHKCAQQIAAHHGGQFPANAEQLAELPGIGRSTAAAVAAFAFGQRAAILDGNVKRVLCRQFGIEGFPGQAAIHRQLWDLAESLLPRRHRALHAGPDGPRRHGARAAGRAAGNARWRRLALPAVTNGRANCRPASRAPPCRSGHRPSCCSTMAPGCCWSAARRAACGVVCWCRRKASRAR
jgi:endonuclease III